VIINKEKISKQNSPAVERSQIRGSVEDVINRTKVIDVHTHLFSREFGDLGLYGIDELLTYHYLVAEMFRSASVSPEFFWRMSKTAQADLVWKTLFVENTPLSEATRGVITLLNAFGLNTAAPDLAEARGFFGSKDPAGHIDRVLEISGVSSVVMTNDPFDGKETQIWEKGLESDPRFLSSLRMDRLLNDWQKTRAKLSQQGYEVEAEFNEKTVSEVRRFLEKWIALMNPLYLAVSLPDDFIYPAGPSDGARDMMLQKVVLPTARDHGIPLSLMIGVRRRVNPALHAAGDGVGRADVKAVENLCRENPDVRFLTTFLSRENQHELCVAARKFSNLMPFGCWWFLNNPSTVAEITRERLEMLGTSFIPQHSDARVLEQLIYKWAHSRKIFIDVLTETYEQIFDAGRAINLSGIERDVKRLFSGNFSDWINPAITLQSDKSNGNGAEKLTLRNKIGIRGIE
jgi:hypothetical protein